jgi:hypothetical protein
MSVKGQWHCRTYVIIVLALVCICVGWGQEMASRPDCTVRVWNRVVSVQEDGSWVIPDVPSNFGLVRARVVCVVGDTVVYGESASFELSTNRVVIAPPIVFGSASSAPVEVNIDIAEPIVDGGHGKAAITVTAVDGEGRHVDITDNVRAHEFLVSNSAIAAVNENREVIGIASGRVLVSVVYEGRSASSLVSFVLGGDRDLDGLPDDYEIANGLDPNDPSDALADLDRDGLTNLDEFRLGTDIRNPDTDGDGLSDGEEVLRGTNPLLADTDGDLVPDGVEVQLGTNPLDPLSVDLARAISRIEVTPVAPTLITSSLAPEASVRLRVNAVLIDNSLLDLTPTARGTRYTSSNLNICNFGATPGEVFAGQPGTCTVTVTNGPFQRQIPVRVENFEPTVRSQLTILGAVALDIAGSMAVVVGGSTFRTVDISNRAAPVIRGSLTIPAANLQDVRVRGNLAYAAAGTGVAIVDISNPLTPQLLRVVETNGNAQDVALGSDNRLYVADGANGLLIFGLADPTNPNLLSATDLGAPVVGVDVDGERGVAVAALGAAGLRVVNVRIPESPGLRGAIPGGDVRDVVVRGNTAYLADLSRSFTSVNITDPAAPAITASLNRVFGGLLLDVAISGDFATGADVFFVNDVPLIDISSPQNPVARFILRFPGDASGTGVKLDSSFVYLISGNQLSIGQYRAITDNNGIPPTVSILNPAPGSTVIARTTVPVTIQAIDDVQVAAVQLLVNGEVVGTATAPPYVIGLPIRAGIDSIAFRRERSTSAAMWGCHPKPAIT